MPDYDALAAQGIYSLQGMTALPISGSSPARSQIPSSSILGATFDSLNYRAGTGVEALTRRTGRGQSISISAPNSVAGFNVNTIAIEVPITLLTSDGAIHAATDPKGTIGAWATTSRAEVTDSPV